MRAANFRLYPPFIIMYCRPYQNDRFFSLALRSIRSATFLGRSCGLRCQRFDIARLKIAPHPCIRTRRDIASSRFLKYPALRARLTRSLQGRLISILPRTLLHAPCSFCLCIQLCTPPPNCRCGLQTVLPTYGRRCCRSSRNAVCKLP